MGCKDKSFSMSQVKGFSHSAVALVEESGSKTTSLAASVRRCEGPIHSMRAQNRCKMKDMQGEG
jgi:hypothetical protein